LYHHNLVLAKVNGVKQAFNGSALNRLVIILARLLKYIAINPIQEESLLNYPTGGV
jgi:hypothetical protein